MNTLYLIFFVATASSSSYLDLFEDNQSGENKLSDQDKKFRDDFKLNENLNIFYKKHSVPLSWSDASLTCLAEGATLVVPHNTSELEELKDLIKDDDDFFWVGIHDRYAEGVFLTLDGERMENELLRWNTREPNDAFPGEDCVSLKSDGLFSDHKCTIKHKFVCTKKLTDEEFNSECHTYDKEYIFHEPNKCYKFHENALSWNMSVRICNAENASLVVINDLDEANFITEFFKNHTQSSGNFIKNWIHIGFSDLLIPGLYMTMEGKPLSKGYSKWCEGQPDGLDNRERCGAMDKNGLLHDVVCDNRATFICEKTIPSS